MIHDVGEGGDRDFRTSIVKKFLVMIVCLVSLLGLGGWGGLTMTNLTPIVFLSRDPIGLWGQIIVMQDCPKHGYSCSLGTKCQ